MYLQKIIIHTALYKFSSQLSKFYSKNCLRIVRKPKFVKVNVKMIMSLEILIFVR
jgi:hypothetical protein